MSRKHAHIHRGPAVNYDMALAAARAYAEGRGGAVDPTESLPDEARDYVRAKTLEHIQRLEQNRVTRADAARYRSSRDYTGELVPSDPSGPEVVADLVPATWDELRASMKGMQ